MNWHRHPGCVCDLSKWHAQPNPPCDEWADDPTGVATCWACEHERACHKPEAFEEHDA